MTLYAYTLDNARDVKDRFQAFDRDCYPLEVYQAILDYELELADGIGQSRALDVIAWCCDISETTLESENRPLLESNADEDDLYTLADLADRLRDKTTILFADESTGTVYHLAY